MSDDDDFREDARDAGDRLGLELDLVFLLRPKSQSDQPLGKIWTQNPGVKANIMRAE